MTHTRLLANTLTTLATLAPLAGLLLLSSCTIQQQREVLGAVGTVIPGSSTSRIPSLYSSSSSSAASTSPSAAPSSPAVATPPPSPAPTAAVTPPAPKSALPAQTVDVGRADAEWVLQTLQKAMGNDPAPFQECLNNTPCKTALSAHLRQLQKRAGGTIELPAVYDQYDLERGKE